MRTTKHPILNDQAAPVIGSPFRVRLNSGTTTPLLVAVTSTEGCEGCFAENKAITCAQLPSCCAQFRADDKDCIFTLYTGVSNNGT